MKTVLIVGGGLQAISVARSLKEVGYQVGIWCPQKDYARKSSAISFYGFNNNDEEIKGIADFIISNNVDVAIPMSDKYTILLSSHRNELACAVGAPDIDVLEVATDKQKLMELCKNNDLPHPLTWDSSNYNPSEIKFPLLIKPNHSVGARGITLVRSHAELQKQLSHIQSKYGECHLQEYIEGNRPYYNVMLYRAKDGSIHAYTILKIIRYYPLEGGSSSMCKTVENNELIEICVKTLEVLGYVGFADFDVLQTINGDYKIIEINPRVPASIRGAAISGINFPAVISADALDEDLPIQKYIPGKTLRYLGLDIMWFIASPNRFKSNWFNFLGRNVFYQEGGFKDLKPMIASLLQNFNKIQFKGGKISKRNSL